jgi:hypothetical protein
LILPVYRQPRIIMNAKKIIRTDIALRIKSGSSVASTQTPIGSVRHPARDNGTTRPHSTSRSALGISCMLVTT